MKLLLSDHQLHLRFAPLTLTRPVAELRCGLFTNTERWQLLLPTAQIGFETESYLSGKFPANEGIWINAQCIANAQFADRISSLEDDRMVAIRGRCRRLAVGGERLRK